MGKSYNSDEISLSHLIRELLDGLVFLTSGGYDTTLQHKPEEPDKPCLASQTCPHREIN